MSVRVAAATALRLYFKPWICLQSVWAAWKWSICETDLCNRLQRRIPNLTVRGLSESCCTHLRIKASSSRRELSTPFCIPPLCYSFQPMLRSWLHLKIHLESSGPVNDCTPQHVNSRHTTSEIFCRWQSSKGERWFSVAYNQVRQPCQLASKAVVAQSSGSWSRRYSGHESIFWNFLLSSRGCKIVKCFS